MRIVVLIVSLLMVNSVMASGQEAGMNITPLEKATFAGGCFWCMQPFFDHLKGVKKTVVGYTGGRVANPTYEDVSGGQTGHAESIEVTYDPKEVSYERILTVYWHNINPTQVNGQFVDEGTQYRTVIFYHNQEQKQIAENSRKALQASGRFSRPIVTAIEPAGPFYPAEDYHQKYYQKSPFRYNMYHAGSGRDEYKENVWGRSDEQM
jgi:methionine-S-sulfoxide reductase